MEPSVAAPLGITLLLASLTGLGLLIRRYFPARYGDFWRVWGDPPHTFLGISAGMTLVNAIIAALKRAFPQQMMFLGGLHPVWDSILGAVILALGGIAPWFLFRNT